MAVGFIHKLFSDWGYQLKRNSLYGVAKESLVTLNAGPVTSGAGGAFAGLGQSVGVIAAIGLTTALSAALTQMDYHHQRDGLRKLYHEEIGSLLHKPAGKVKDRDLEKIARGDATGGVPANRVIGETLKKLKQSRTLGVTLSIMASLAAFGVVGFTAEIPAIAALGEGLLHILAQGTIGVLAYNAVKLPLHWAGEKFMGLDRETVSERIEALAEQRGKGREITREQVFSVFSAANAELDVLIKGRYGKSFEQLDSNARSDILDHIGRLMKIDQLTDAINTGTVNASELAFAVEGQSSGVVHEHTYKAEPRVGILSKVTGAFSGLVSGFTRHAPVAQTHAHEAPERSFVDLVNKSRADRPVGR